MVDKIVLTESGLGVVGPLHVARDASGAVIEEMPQKRYVKAGVKRLHRWGTGPFCRLTVAAAPSFAGVYAILHGEMCLYVGESQNIKERFGPRGYGSIQPVNCYEGGQRTNCKLNHLVLLEARKDHRLEVWCGRSEDRKRVEDVLIERLRPPWNGEIAVPGSA